MSGPGVEKYSRGAGGGFHLLGGALADAFGFAIAPNVGGQYCLVPLVNQIAHGLTHEMRRDGKTFQVVFRKQRPFPFDVIGFGERTVHFEVIAPAGEFHAVVAHRFDFGREVGERKVGPLAGEQGDRSWHDDD